MPVISLLFTFLLPSGNVQKNNLDFLPITERYEKTTSCLKFQNRRSLYPTAPLTGSELFIVLSFRLIIIKRSRAAIVSDIVHETV